MYAGRDDKTGQVAKTDATAGAPATDSTTPPAAAAAQGDAKQAPLKDVGPIEASWNSVLHAFPQEYADMLLQANQKRIKIRQKFFNQCVQIYQDELDAKPNESNLRAKKITIANQCIGLLDKPITDLTTLNGILGSVTGHVKKNMLIDSGGGRLKGALDELKKQLDDLKEGLENKLGKAIPIPDHTAIESLKYALLRKYIPTHRDLTPAEKQFQREVIAVKSVACHISMSSSSLEKEANANRKLVALFSIMHRQTTDIAELSNVLINHSIAHYVQDLFRETIMAYFINELRFNPLENQEWYINQLNCSDRVVALLEHYIYKDFEKELMKDILKGFNKESINAVIEKLLNECKSELKWESEADDNKHKNHALKGIGRMLGVEIKRLEKCINAVYIHHNHESHKLLEMKKKGETASSALEISAEPNSSKFEFEIDKRIGFMASIILDARQLSQSMQLQNVNEGVPVNKADVKQSGAAVKAAIPLSQAQHAALFSAPANPQKEVIDVVRLRNNLQQIVNFYRAKHHGTGIYGQGVHIAVIRFFEKRLSAAAGKSEAEQLSLYTNALKEFWDFKVKEHDGKEADLVATVNSKEGHHLTRMVGMVMQDIGFIQPCIQPYKRYHGDYYLELVKSLPAPVQRHNPARN